MSRSAFTDSERVTHHAETGDPYVRSRGGVEGVLLSSGPAVTTCYLSGVVELSTIRIILSRVRRLLGHAVDDTVEICSPKTGRIPRSVSMC
jgi:hypothetical protein